MVLNTCKTSAVIDIEGAENYFTNIYLNEFPSENISDIATTDINRINIMRCVYSLPTKPGITLLLKV